MTKDLTKIKNLIIRFVLGMTLLPTILFLVAAPFLAAREISPWFLCAYLLYGGIIVAIGGIDD